MMRAIPDHGYVIDGHDISRADALVRVAGELSAAGVPAAEVEEALIDRRGLVARAWWGGDGFVQEHHDGAAPVTVVNVIPPAS